MERQAEYLDADLGTRSGRKICRTEGLPAIDTIETIR
jgi:hypothetical protein